MTADEVVQLTVVPSETEAAMLCGLLESRGVRATYDKGSVLASPYALGGALTGAHVGRPEILVHARDLDAARAILAETPPS